jgi:hypothetical protein
MVSILTFNSFVIRGRACRFSDPGASVQLQAEGAQRGARGRYRGQRLRRPAGPLALLERPNELIAPTPASISPAQPQPIMMAIIIIHQNREVAFDAPVSGTPGTHMAVPLSPTVNPPNREQFAWDG